jgi:hypothetical protein
MPGKAGPVVVDLLAPSGRDSVSRNAEGRRLGLPAREPSGSVKTAEDRMPPDIEPDTKTRLNWSSGQHRDPGFPRVR